MRKITDTMRLDRIFAEHEDLRGEIHLEINVYGKGAQGNTTVSIENRADLDVVILKEREAQRVKKICPVCELEYNKTEWRALKQGTSGYRGFRHIDSNGVRWCKGRIGQHFCEVETR